MVFLETTKKTREFSLTFTLHLFLFLFRVANRINSLYLWYKERTKIIEDLRKINMKSYKELDEITDEEMKTWAENKQEEDSIYE